MNAQDAIAFKDRPEIASGVLRRFRFALGWDGTGEPPIVVIMGNGELTDEGEAARQFVGRHFQEIKQAITDQLEGASVTGPYLSAERAGQLATLAMAAMSHVYPDAPWQGEINEALHAFADRLVDPEQDARALEALGPDLLAHIDNMEAE